ncbi:MAG: hypothetical protein H6557_33145 [Lewinellaceae bacterium]|nr:hypothetical protein [Phaeodactylibacter sp.]MCB9041492.1 hypothetical protein [Lewinellaceae bacterium]
MPKIRYLKIRFANALFPYEVPCFRSAVIEATERQSSLFHNHKQEGFHYRYPLIQYKVTDKKASIICLESGTDDIHYLLQQRSLSLRIGQHIHDFEIEDVQLRYHQVQSWQARFHYALLHWQALNQENYRRYSALQTEVERLQFLEKMLLGNLLAFARSINWEPEHSIELSITRLKGEKWLPFKGRKVITFTLNFSANVSLPDYIGLGKGVSVGFGSVLGFGEVEPIRKVKTESAEIQSEE